MVATIKETTRAYYRLTKPGIIYGNGFTTVGAFLLASEGHIDFGLLIATLAGVSLVIGSGCVYNNYIDRGIDKKMARTKERALVKGTIPGSHALVFAVILTALGLSILETFVNMLTVWLGILGLFFYVVLYGISKRKSVYGTIVGSVSGALPPVAGYCAVTGRFDSGALILFLILTFWQMPHFYAIAMYRHDDYAEAGLPVLPVSRGMKTAKIHIIIYGFAFLLATLSLALYGYTGCTYAVIMGVLGTMWIWKGIAGFKTTDDKRWGRKMFLFSLIVLTSFSVLISLEWLLP
jgi:protoheme IX farnesyltransferase